MKSFQLDECFNDKRLADACNAEGRCTVRRFPRRLKEKKDPVILPDLLAKDAPVVTIDFTIVPDNAAHIPNVNSGLIVVRSKNSRKPFTSKSAAMNMSRLKQRFPAWSEIDWSGVYIEIDEEELFISELKKDMAGDHGMSIKLDVPRFSDTVMEMLDKIKNSVHRRISTSGK